jgi:hypothetical protein
MEQEQLHFRIGLSGTSTKKQPEFKISISGHEYLHGTLSVDQNEIEYFEFDVELSEGANSLDIAFLNKINNDTVLDADGNIVDDVLLTINSVEIDEIDLGNLIWTASAYRPIYPAVYAATQALESELKNCVNLGWNGTWSLPFAVPFYIWLLENI